MKLKKFFTIFLTFFVVILTFQTRVNASEALNESLFTPDEIEYLKKKGVLKMCVDPLWEPFEKLTEKGEYIGMASSYLEVIKKKTGLNIEIYKTTSWTETVEAAKARKCDFYSLVAKTPEREEYMLYSTPYLVMDNALVAKNDKPFVSNILLIRDKKIGVVDGYATHEMLKKKYPEINLVPVKNPKDGLLKLAAGEIDYMNDFLASASFYIGQLALSDIRIVGTTDLTFPLGYASRNDEPLLNDILDKSVKLISEQEKIEVLKRWITVEMEKKLDYSLAWKILLGATIIFIVIILWNRQLSSEIRKRKLAEEIAQEERANAIAANNAKSDFLANMSHEIRTPMNAIMGMAHEVLDTELSKENRTNLEIISQQSESLLSIINDILDFAKIEAGKMEVNAVTFSLTDEIVKITQGFDVIFKRKGIKLTCDIHKELRGSYISDFPKIRQILNNLIGNSYKFTQKGSVDLSVELLKENKKDVIVKFSVSDTGIGIASDKLDKIFESFAQAHPFLTKENSGTGLGLSISKRIVELLKGQISVESREGNGSTFSFIIVLEKTEAIKEKVKNNGSEPTDVSGGRILLVEDNLINQKIVMRVLGDKKCDVTCANNGKAALEVLAHEEFDVILMDVQMPIMDGLEATRRIREGNGAVKNTAVPIIALTANAFDEDKKECLEAGMNDFITKPVNRELLVNTIAKYLAARPE